MCSNKHEIEMRKELVKFITLIITFEWFSLFFYSFFIKKEDKRQTESVENIKKPVRVLKLLFWNAYSEVIGTECHFQKGF